MLLINLITNLIFKERQKTKFLGLLSEDSSLCQSKNKLNKNFTLIPLLSIINVTTFTDDCEAEFALQFSPNLVHFCPFLSCK